MQSNQHRSTGRYGVPTLLESTPAGEREFGEHVPDYLQPGYRALMMSDGFTAIGMWEAIYNRYPSAEICGHLARAHYYQTFFLEHPLGHPLHAEHIRQMRLWAERALSLNPNSSIGHAMLSAAIGRQAQITGSQKEIVRSSWQIQYHSERAIAIDGTWIGHYVLGNLHRELASVNPMIRAVAQILGVKMPRGTYESSLEHFREILRQYPDNNTIYAELAYTYIRRADFKSASENFERCFSMPLFKHPISKYLTAIALEHYRKNRW
jgi:tetratricopeptide (TPR) repeat protein